MRAELDETMLMVGQPDPAILEIDEAIERLAKKK